MAARVISGDDDELIQVSANDNRDSGNASDEDLISDGNFSAAKNQVQQTSASNARNIVSLIVLLFVNLLNYMDRYTIAGWTHLN